MGPLGILTTIRHWIGSVAFWIFVWSTGLTKEAYWDQVYETEKCIRGIEEARGRMVSLQGD